MDFAGPYTPSRNGARYVLRFIDQLTKWVELVATQLAITIIQKFYQNIICRHGCPKFLLSDRGPQFHGSLVAALCENFGIEKIFSSAYYPQGDGFAERFMRTLNNSLSALSRHDPERWDEFLSGLAFAHNSSGHAATGVSPFLLCTGRNPRLPGDSLVESGPLATTASDYLKKLRNIISRSHERARNAVQAYWERVKKSYDKNHREVKIKVGDLVLVRLSDYERQKFPVLKIAPRWSNPCAITKILQNGVTFYVGRESGPEAVHASRLLPLKGEHWTLDPKGTDASGPVDKVTPKVIEKKKPEVIESDSDEEVEVTLYFKPPVLDPATTQTTATQGQILDSAPRVRDVPSLPIPKVIVDTKVAKVMPGLNPRHLDRCMLRP